MQMYYVYTHSNIKKAYIPNTEIFFCILYKIPISMLALHIVIHPNLYEND